MPAARRRASPGFTLAELLVALALMGVVLMGLTTFQHALLRDKGKMMGEITARNEADFARRMVIRDVSEATTIAFPPTATAANELVGLKNVRSDNLSFQASATPARWTAACAGALGSDDQACINSLVDTNGNGIMHGEDSEFFRYCLKEDPERDTAQLFYYHRSSLLTPTPSPGAVAALPLPPLPCGENLDPPDGTTMELIIGNLSGYIKVRPRPGSAGIFQRNTGGAGQHPNYVSVEFDVFAQGSTVTVRAGSSFSTPNITE